MNKKTKDKLLGIKKTSCKGPKVTEPIRGIQGQNRWECIFTEQVKIIVVYLGVAYMTTKPYGGGGRGGVNTG